MVTEFKDIRRKVYNMWNNIISQKMNRETGNYINFKFNNLTSNRYRKMWLIYQWKIVMLMIIVAVVYFLYYKY